ncbi:MAG: hypothetical protein Q8L07_04195 [Sediminibacterium sp.]|nr:hypothetical protein [Sediminibacterium sp.]
MVKGNNTNENSGKLEEVSTTHDCFNGKVVLLENTKLGANVKKRYLVHQERKEKFHGHPGYLTLEEAGAKTNEVLNDTMF